MQLISIDVRHGCRFVFDQHSTGVKRMSSITLVNVVRDNLGFYYAATINDANQMKDHGIHNAESWVYPFTRNELKEIEKTGIRFHLDGKPI